MQDKLAVQSSMPNTKNTHNITSIANTQEVLAATIRSDTQEPSATTSIIKSSQTLHSQY